MQLTFKCPKCSKPASLVLTDSEVERIQSEILENGRSPTLLSRCSNHHDLLVTLYFRDGELGIRDVVVPLDAGDEDREGDSSSELDWVRKTFGGD